MVSVISPCIQICKIDEETRLCFGCYRTLAEIGAWPGLNEREKGALLETLKRRAQEAGAKRAVKGRSGLFRSGRERI